LDQLKRTDIRSPQDGTVFQSSVHTVGGVIPAGEPVMLIVPEADKLTVEAKVNPQDIDKVQFRTKRCVTLVRVQYADHS
jgi:HlyD family secretion protein